MIIQAGYDFHTLARPLIHCNGQILPNLIVIGLDAEMQLDSIELVTSEFRGSLEPFRDPILDKLDPEFATYFAILHPGAFEEDGFSDPLRDEARLLELAAAERGLKLIGHFAIDETGYMSARAHSYFDQYPSHSDLPRTMTHWVHSEFGSCD